MKAKNVFNLGLISCVLFMISCNYQNHIKTNMALQIVSDTVTNTTINQNGKEDYELAAEFIEKLKKGNTDTIIYYQRTCINCCDFFNIFWSEKGKKYLAKFYFDDTQIIDLKDDEIFNFLNQNFYELKEFPIKDNVHNINGQNSFSIIDHYCYSKLNIYTKNDSIITDIIKDHDFDKYTDFDSYSYNQSETRQTNDNYMENINSKWNLFLMKIDNEIESMSETTKGEKEALRKNRSK